MNKGKFYKNYEILVIISTIVTIFLGVISDKGEGYELIFLIPLIYFFLFILNKPMHKYSKTHYGMLMLNLVLYLKYVIAIFCIIINKDYSNPIYTGTVPAPESCMQAIIYILIEMIFIFGVVFLFANTFYKNENSNNNMEKNFQKIKLNMALIAFFAIVGLIAINNFNIFMPTQLLFISDEYAILKEESTGSLEVIFFAFKTILMGIIINHCILKYQKNEKMRYVIFSYITILVYVILNTSTSRINMIVPILFFALITKEIFGKKGRVLLGVTVGILILSISSITVYKSAWLFKNEDYNLLDIAKVMTNQIQEYTSGIRPVAQGIEAVERYRNKITFNTLVNDLFGSVPIVNALFNGQNRINIYYNMYILGSTTKNHPLIMPLVAISSAYFSYAGCWILTAINILVMMYLDGKSSKYRKNYLSTYMMTYLLFVLASSVYGNLQMIVGRIFTRFLPIVLIMYINDKIIMRREKNE